jgi:hypothetical protein
MNHMRDGLSDATLEPVRQIAVTLTLKEPVDEGFPRVGWHPADLPPQVVAAVEHCRKHGATAHGENRQRRMITQASRGTSQTRLPVTTTAGMVFVTAGAWASIEYDGRSNFAYVEGVSDEQAVALVLAGFKQHRDGWLWGEPGDDELPLRTIEATIARHDTPPIKRERLTGFDEFRAPSRRERRGVPERTHREPWRSKRR